jgi:catalase
MVGITPRRQRPDQGSWQAWAAVVTSAAARSTKGVVGGANTYARDGSMRASNGAKGPKYEPNSLGGPQQPDAPYSLGYELNGAVGTYALSSHPEDNDYVQAGALYRVMKEDERERLIDNLSGSLAQVTLPDVVERSVAHFMAADPEYGARLDVAIKVKREKS